MIVVKKKTTAQAMVARSRLRSATVDPAAACPSPPPNISDSPPPLPLCNKIMPISNSDTMTWMTMMMAVTARWRRLLLFALHLSFLRRRTQHSRTSPQVARQLC